MAQTQRSPLAQRLLPQKGLYSHRSAPSPRAARHRMGLQLAACTVLLTGSFATPTGMAVNAGIFGLFMLAIWILGEGLRAEDDYRARPAARAPRLPLKLLAAGLTGGAVGLTFLARSGNMVEAALAAALAVGLHVAAFGTDPRADKDDLISAVSADRVDGFVAEAEADLAAIRTALASLHDPDINRACDRFSAAVTDLLDGLAMYPQGIALCRKHLTVFVQSIRATSLRYARLHAQSPDPVRSKAFMQFLSDAEQSYKSQADSVRLRNNDALDMDIGVLRDALQREVSRPG